MKVLQWAYKLFAVFLKMNGSLHCGWCTLIPGRSSCVPSCRELVILGQNLLRLELGAEATIMNETDTDSPGFQAARSPAIFTGIGYSTQCRRST